MKKECNKYYLSLEGETEQWYFEHLQNLINNEEKLPYKVKFVPKINKSIINNAKSITAIYPVKAFHICDYESNDEVHIEQFRKVLEELKDVKDIKPNIDYQLGYSNFTFELWIIVHKMQQKNGIAHRRLYVNGINRAYNENFQFIDDYKEERNFKRVLSRITLKDVINAVKNGDEIIKENKLNKSYAYRQFGQFEYYIENPDMTINKCVRQILEEAGVKV